MRLGLIGHGAIGKAVVAAAAGGQLGPKVELVAVLVRQERPPSPGLTVTTDRARFLGEHPDVVLEAAGHEAVRQHAAACLEAGADIVLTSIGALTDATLLASLEATAGRAKRRILLASAGIGALDILASAAVGGLDAVTVTVRKNSSAWRGTPAEQLVDLGGLRQPAVLFDGPVRAGAAAYPQNVNIAAAAALAGIGLDRTRLVIVAAPGITDHIVEIEAQGAFGRFSFREEVRPTLDNPKTGQLVAMAVVRTIRDLAATLVVGG